MVLMNAFIPILLHLHLFIVVHPEPVTNHPDAAIIPTNPRSNSKVHLRKHSATSHYGIYAANRSSCRFKGPMIPCECLFEVSDTYYLEENDERIAMFAVGPPHIEIHVPSHHDMLHELDVQIVPKLCVREKFTVKLLYRPEQLLPDETWSTVATESAILHDELVDLVFSCENFANAGIYKIALVNSVGYEIEDVQWIRVNGSAGVSLELRNDSIFPHCKTDLPIRWTTARCEAARISYRIRILAVPEGAANHEHRSHYIEEVDVTHEQALLSIPCSQFDIYYVKYCFELVSVEAKTSVFHLWRTTCVNTEPAVTANATWSGWSQWSECSATCGESVQKRYRFCENPEPKRAPDCVGDMIETRPCVVPDCPGKLKTQPLLANCSCGCVLSGTSGSFFATAADAQVCAGNQTWSMPARHNKAVADFKVVTDDEAPGKLFFFLRAPYEELVWFSGSNQDQEFTLRLDRAIFIVLWYKGNNSESMERKGYTISYSTREITTQVTTRTWQSCQPLCPETVIIVLLCLLFLFIIFIPPFFCAAMTKRLRRRSCHERPLIDKVYDNDMIRSGNTECTQTSGDKPSGYTAQRSIGIQLSVQSTPRCARTFLPTDSPTPHGTSNSTADELEYDYYDGTTIPGSLLAPVNDYLMCEIEIDQIIAQSSLYSKPVDTHDVYTQV